MSNAIDACKDIPAVDIARAAGIALRHNGGREWACCPFHHEKTPSMMFDDEGRFHCFGCGADGDGIDFYGQLYHIEDVKAAAEALAKAFGRGYDPEAKYAPLSKSPEAILKNNVEAWYKRTWDTACQVKHKAIAVLEAEQARLPDGNACWDSPAFCAAAEARALAESTMDILLESTLFEKVMMMAREAG